MTESDIQLLDELQQPSSGGADETVRVVGAVRHQAQFDFQSGMPAQLLFEKLHELLRAFLAGFVGIEREDQVLDGRVGVQDQIEVISGKRGRANRRRILHARVERGHAP